MILFFCKLATTKHEPVGGASSLEIARHIAHGMKLALMHPEQCRKEVAAYEMEIISMTGGAGPEYQESRDELLEMMGEQLLKEWGES